MVLKAGKENIIKRSAQISADISIGNFNYIGENVVISGFKGQSSGVINIGDCNYIHDNTRIIMGYEGLSIGDWNVFHNSMLIMGQKRMEIGHNCWFGQNTILDATSGLYIGNGVRVGMYSQIWTHVASGELIEGCTLHAMRPTYIDDEVWLVGSCIVSSGLRLARRSICLTGAVLVKDTVAGKVYGGIPAKHLEKLHYWKNVPLRDKMQMMLTWSRQFVEQSSESIELVYKSESSMIQIKHKARQEMLIIGMKENSHQLDKLTTYFNLKKKTYTKRLTMLEREFYKFIYDHKARFVPDSKVSIRNNSKPTEMNRKYNALT